MFNLLDSVLENTETLIQRAHNESVQPLPVIQPVNDNTGIFEVVERSIHTQEFGKIDGKKALLVNGKCVNVVSDSYQIHQPSEILAQFQKVAASHNLQVNRVLPNSANGGLLLSAKYNDVSILGENHDINLTFYTSHCGRYRTILSLDLLRIACYNQLPLLYRNKSRHIISEKHYKNSLNIDLIGQCIENIPASVEAYAQKAQALSEKRLSFNDLLDLYVEHYKLDAKAKQYHTTIDRFKATWLDAPGCRGLPDNAYKAYQAITFDNTHGGRNTKFKNETIITKNSDDSLIVLEKLLAA